MLLPALSKARAKARTISCVNNEKQILLGVRLYLDENQGYFPNFSNGAGCYNNSKYYENNVLEYATGIQNPNATFSNMINGKDLFLCPSSTETNGKTRRFVYDYQFAAQCQTLMDDAVPGHSHWATYGVFPNSPSECGILLDGCFGEGWGQGGINWDRGKYVCARHDRNINIGFLDGHVETWKGSKVEHDLTPFGMNAEWCAHSWNNGISY